MAERVLVVDDEREICDLVALYLENEGLVVERLYDGAAALARVRDEAAPTPDLAILDVMLPGTDGFALCRAIRERHAYPVIMLTARGEQADKISGLALGADDYVTKPFLPLELVARVKAQLRRYKRYGTAGERAEAGPTLVCRGLVMDVPAHSVTLNERPLALTPTEFSLLRILLEAEGAVVSARDLYFKTFGEAYYEKGSGSITVHIRHLREKMGDSFEDPRYIRTVWGCGYKIER
ncbi:response regulator transcription factor [Olsenella sp. An290]|uniref:response regulator transcription factor n=1 Tax=Olsenella sp. An290 TaxID=1965625 RepID=UPI000B385FE1|nr:response regulator transcription factor [Olsenella sp. An290]OUO34680.1 DNA-binding response regulator [Olsenella sp. An290]